MIELRNYGKSELAQILGTNDRQGMIRKLDSWGVLHDEPRGRGEYMTVNITGFQDIFKVYALAELGVHPNTDFKKLRDFYYYFLNDEEFAAMPDEVKERRMESEGKYVSRQTIATYTRKLEEKGVFMLDSKNYIYYFVHKKQYRIAERKEYLSAWRQYWDDKESGLDSAQAIYMMKQTHGGVARKQPIPQFNGIYNDIRNTINDYIQESYEREIEAFEAN